MEDYLENAIALRNSQDLATKLNLNSEKPKWLPFYGNAATDALYGKQTKFIESVKRFFGNKVQVTYSRNSKIDFTPAGDDSRVFSNTIQTAANLGYSLDNVYRWTMENEVKHRNSLKRIVPEYKQIVMN